MKPVELTSLEHVLIATWPIQSIILLRAAKPATGTLAVGYARRNLVSQCMKHADVIIAGTLVT